MFTTRFRLGLRFIGVVAAVPAAMLWCTVVARAQPDTLLPQPVVEGLANTVSGSQPMQHLIDFTGYNRDRNAEEFAGTYLESELFARWATEYGFSDVEILRYPRRPMWDGIRGELWVTSPVLRKVVDFRDIPTALASGSVSGTYEGEMVWIENAGDEAAYEGLDVTGKIILTDSSTGRAYRQARSHGALGVVNMNSPRPYVAPDAIVWSGIRPGDDEAGFAFNLSGPMVQDLRQLRGTVTLKAIVEAEMREVDNEVITAVIPGDGSTDEWVYYSAHVFEGATKQGAADDGSGAVIILEAGRTILEAIERGYVSRPARNIRFLWVDEFSGTYAYLDSHTEEFAKATADINIDMAGQNVTLANNATRLYRMPDARIHFLGDVCQEFFELVGLTNMERVHERGGGYRFTFPIIDPYGTRDMWRYEIEPFYGSSDHQVYNDRGVPAVLFNHWPDPVYHSSHDRPGLMDATQMKRTAFIAAAAGLVVAGAPETDPMQVAAQAYTRGKARIADDLRRWTLQMAAAPAGDLAIQYKESAAALHQWHLREHRNVLSVNELTRGSTCENPDRAAKGIEALAQRVLDEEPTAQASLEEFYQSLAAVRGVEATIPDPTEDEIEAGNLVPRWDGEYERSWARGLPGFASMEVRNFIDGRRSVLEIRNAVNSEYALEYGTITLDAVLSYLRSLEEAGSVAIEPRN
ncbi:MAG: M28 family peptidase [Planctomycetes bacterium]|nr:M28 family peptidase [Planctomycetota bacterium]